MTNYSVLLELELRYFVGTLSISDRTEPFQVGLLTLWMLATLTWIVQCTLALQTPNTAFVRSGASKKKEKLLKFNSNRNSKLLYQTWNDEMRRPHKCQIQPLSSVQGVERNDSPESVQKNCAQAQHCWDHEKVLMLSPHSNGARAGTICEDVD